MNKELSSKKNMGIALAMNLLVFLVCLFVLGSRPRNNDDTIIHMVTSGVYGTASAKLGHINVLFGQLLVLLGRLVPMLNWVQVIEVGMTFVLLVCVTAILLQKQPGVLGWCLAAIILTVFAPRFYLNLHYTRFVILLAAGGFYVFFHGIETRKPFYLVVGALCTVFASIVRFGAFLSGAAFAFFVGLVLLFSRGKTTKVSDFFRQNARLLLGTLVLFVVIFGLLGYDVVMVATDEELAATRRYNDARRKIADYELPDYDSNREQYMALGLSRNDWEILQSWNHADMSLYPVETLEAVVAMQQSRSFSRALREMVSLMRSSTSYRNLYVIATLAVPILMLPLVKKGMRLRTMLMPMVFVGVLVLLGYIGRATPWVTEGNAAAAFLGTCLLLPQDALCRQRYRGRVVMSIGLAVLCAACSGYTLYQYGVGIGYYTVKEEALAYYEAIRQDADNLYLHDIDLAHSQERIVEPFRALPKGLFQNLYFLGGWDSGTPPRNAVLERYGVASPYQALVEEDNVYLLIDYKENGMVSKITSVIREHVSNLVRCARVTAPCGLPAYTFTNGQPRHARAEEQIPLVQGSITIDETDQLFYAVELRMDEEWSEGATAYVALYEDGDEQTTLQYRVPIEGNLIAFSFPTFDLPLLPDTLEAVVYLEADGETVCSDRFALRYE